MLIIPKNSSWDQMVFLFMSVWIRNSLGGVGLGELWATSSVNGLPIVTESLWAAYMQSTSPAQKRTNGVCCLWRDPDDFLVKQEVAWVLSKVKFIEIF